MILPGDGVVLVVMTDGRREYLPRTLRSLDELVTGNITRRIIHDDSADPNYRDWISREHPGYEIAMGSSRHGFTRAVQSTFTILEHCVTEPWVLWLEDDFVFDRPADLGDAIRLLTAQPHLAQAAFRRQPWGSEPRPGGFMAQAPHLYVERSEADLTWVETVRNWTNNPCVFRRELCSVGWPDGPHSEGLFSFQLRERGLPWGVSGDDVRFGFVGGMESGRDWVRHIGEHRNAGSGGY